MRILIILFFVLLLSPSIACADQLLDAQKAYDREAYQDARELVRPLADQGNAEAQYDIGDLYNDGKGVPQDYVEAYFWFSLAVKNGFPTNKLTEAATHLTPEQIAAAKKRADEWKATKSPLEAGYERCHLEFPGTPDDRTFQNLDAVGFSISSPTSYERSIECHGKERECIAERVHISDNSGEEMFAREIQRLKMQYNNYPSAIRIQNLHRLISQRIRTNILPFVIPNESCEIPELVDEDKLDGYRRSDFTNRKNTLSIIIYLYIIDASLGHREYIEKADAALLKPGYALLSVNFNRPEGILRRTWQILPTIIPLDLPDERISSMVQDFVNTLIVSTPKIQGDPISNCTVRTEKGLKLTEEARQWVPPHIPLSNVAIKLNSKPQ